MPELPDTTGEGGLTPEQREAMQTRLRQLEQEENEAMCEFPDCINRAEPDDTFCRMHKARAAGRPREAML